ncbi:U3 small nucleolar ribonucleoprotein complex subunit Mpp10 [Gracilaria domingensis]|nr:U3 small nucleolar ribonucleoprotein complex subunit Mpp10 [Gracilaria domingensis]
MVETRASRRAAEEDISTSSQPARPRSRGKAASNGSAPAQTSKPRQRSQARDEDIVSSAQTPSKKKGRLRSNSRPQTPAQTPRTRSRARREAEESIASTEVRVSTAHPQPAEEENNDTHTTAAVKTVVCAAPNRKSVSDAASAQEPTTKRNRSRPNARPPTPAQTPRTRSRARREAEESIASSEVQITAPCIEADDENNDNLQSKTTAKMIVSAGLNQESEVVSVASTPSRRMRSVARRTSAFGGRSAVHENGVVRLPNLTLGSNAKRSRSQRMEQSIEPHASDTPDPRRTPSSWKAQLEGKELTEMGDGLPTEQFLGQSQSIDFEDVRHRAEKQIQRTKQNRHKSQSPSLNQQGTAKKVSHDDRPLISEFMSNKPLSRDPETSALHQAPTTQHRSTETMRPFSKHSVQGELSEIVARDDVLAHNHLAPLGIPLLPTEFDGFDQDELHAILVEDDEPPPPPPVLKSSGGQTGIPLRNQQKITQELPVGENGKSTIESRALHVDKGPGERSLADTAGRARPKIIMGRVAAKIVEGTAPFKCEVVPKGKALEMRRKAEAPSSVLKGKSKKRAERKAPLPEADFWSREEDEDSLLTSNETKDVSLPIKPPIAADRSHEITENAEESNERSEVRTDREIVSALDDNGMSKQPKDILDAGEISVMKDLEYGREGSAAQDSASSEDCLRATEEVNTRDVVHEGNSFKLLSVEGILNVDEKNMSVFFRRNQETSRTCRKLLGKCYAEQTKFEFGSDVCFQCIPKRRKVLPPMGPLAQIEVGDHFDNDQLWEELELRNKPLLAYLHRKVKAIEKQSKDAERALRRVTMNDGDAGSEPVEAFRAREDREFESEKNIPSADEVPQTELSGAEESAGEVDPTKAYVSKETRVNNGQRRTVRFAETLPSSRSVERKEESELGDTIGDVRVKAKKNKPRLEDGFFSVADMDQFADEAEELALSGKLMASDDERGLEKMSDGSDGEMEELDMENMEDNLGRYLYSDFFDPPSKDSGKGVAKALRLIDEDELSDSDDLEEVPKTKDGTTGDLARGSDEITEGSAELTPLQRMRARSKKRIQVLEEASVAKKSWELRGEVSAFARPKDSLLDTEMQHDIAVKPNMFLSSAINETIEEVIKQRIVDGLFDDVVMRLPEEYVANKSKRSRQELPEISQEKPTEGLAELYAKEFTEEREKKNKEILSSKAVQKELDEPLGEEQKEVNRLFERLSKKLDALSSLHYTPNSDDANADVTVKSNVKAIASEEAIPEGVSSATLLAPNEVYSVDKKDLVGDKELDKETRRAARRRRKSKKRKTRQADEFRKDAIAQADPALAEKRRAEAALLRRGKKLKLAEHDPKLAAQPSTKNLIKRFGVKDPDMESSQLKTPASHFRL